MPCPECGSALRRIDWELIGSKWRSNALGIVSFGLMIAALFLFVGLALGKDRYDLYMRVLVVTSHLFLLFVSFSAARQLHGSRNRGYWTTFWILLILGCLPGLGAIASIGHMILLDLGLIQYQAYLSGFALNLVAVMGVIGSVLLLSLRPYNPRYVIAYAMPMAVCATALLMWVVVDRYSFW